MDAQARKQIDDGIDDPLAAGTDAAGDGSAVLDRVYWLSCIVVKLMISKCPSSRRDLDFDGIAFTFIQKAAPDGRSRGDQPSGAVGIFAGYELVSDFFVLVDVEQDYFRTERNSIPRNLIKIDHRKIRQPLFELSQTNAHKILPFAGRLNNRHFR